MNVLNIKSGSPLDQQPNDVRMASQRRLVERRRVRVASNRVVAVGVFAGIEEQPDDFRTPELGCKRERAMPIASISGWKRLTRFVDATNRRSHDQVDFCATTNQRVDGFEFTMSKRG